MGYLNYPARKGHVTPNRMPWYDIVVINAGALQKRAENNEHGNKFRAHLNRRGHYAGGAEKQGMISL